MNWHNIKAAVNVLFDDSDAPMTDNLLSGVKRPPTQAEVNDWLGQADKRTAAVFVEMEILLSELEHRHPLRARQCRDNIKWLRKKAYKQGLSWGVPGRFTRR